MYGLLAKKKDLILKNGTIFSLMFLISKLILDKGNKNCNSS